jgi:hypothetical protein
MRLPGELTAVALSLAADAVGALAAAVEAAALEVAGTARWVLAVTRSAP